MHGYHRLNPHKIQPADNEPVWTRFSWTYSLYIKLSHLLFETVSYQNNVITEHIRLVSVCPRVHHLIPLFRCTYKLEKIEVLHFTWVYTCPVWLVWVCGRPGERVVCLSVSRQVSVEQEADGGTDTGRQQHTARAVCPHKQTHALNFFKFVDFTLFSNKNFKTFSLHHG